MISLLNIFCFNTYFGCCLFTIKPQYFIYIISLKGANPSLRDKQLWFILTNIASFVIILDFSLPLWKKIHESVKEILDIFRVSPTHCQQLRNF